MRVGGTDVSMKRGWIAHYHDGRVITEDDMPWNKVPEKRKIQRMILKWEDRIWELCDKENYTAPKKR